MSHPPPASSSLPPLPTTKTMTVAVAAPSRVAAKTAAAVRLAALVAVALAPATALAASTRDVPSAAEPPNVHVQLAPAPYGQPWTMRVDNMGAAAVRLDADVRRLSLDVTAPGAKKPVRCTLPAAMLGATTGLGDASRGLVVPPERTYQETFDPRLYCFRDAERKAWVPGATVVAHLGFPSASSSSSPSSAASRAKESRPPHVLEPLEGVEPRVASAKELVAPPVALDAANLAPDAVAASPAPAKPGDGDGEGRLSVTMTPVIDAPDVGSLVATITMTNEGRLPLRTHLTPTPLVLDVQGPRGSVVCRWDADIPQATPVVEELMTTVKPGGHTSVSVMLVPFCPAPTFREPGLYRVRVRLQGPLLTASGPGAVGLEGEFVAVAPALVRLQRGRAPEARPQPRLLPAAPPAAPPAVPPRAATNPG